MNSVMSIKKSFSCLLLFTLSVNESWSKHEDKCGDTHLIRPRGIINSPHYPILHPYEVTCTFSILSPPRSTLKILITDFDVPEDENCDEHPCCNYNWVSLPVNEKPGVYQRLCGNISQSLITVSQIRTVIVFHYYSINFYKYNRGFQLSYSIEKPRECEASDFICKDRTCLKQSLRCDGIPQCSDGDDEIQCPGSHKCPSGELLCSPSSGRCFKKSEMCDDKFQCPFGEDEYGCKPGCEHGIACSRGEGCYLPSERCDGRSHCIDDSDETMCPDELCPVLPNKRQCRNGRCIQSRLWCDGSDDCGDSSDEAACLKNSVITVAMMGALLGGLILVIAVGCSLRVYSRRFTEGRNYQMHVSAPVASRFRMSHSLSLPALIDNEFFRREPPPVYSVAVGNTGLPRRSRTNRSRSSRRFHHHNRHTVAVCVPKPPENIDNNSSPSSEDSLMSTSNVTTSINVDDNEQLLTT